jgi:integrase
VLSSFAEHLDTRTRSKETRRCYLARAGQFCGWLEEEGSLDALGDPAALRRAARRWVALTGEERGWEPATTNAVAAAIGCFASFLGVESLGIRSERVPRRAPRALSDRDVDRVAAAAARMGPRPAALVALMARCGLRVGEVSGLGVADIDGEAGIITVRRGKGGHFRELPMPTEAGAVLERWLAERGDDPGPLFPGGRAPGRGLSTRRIAELMDEVGERAGVIFSPHQLRHSFASRLVRAGVDVVAVAELLGHGSLGYVQAYSRPTQAVLRAILDAAAVRRVAA